MKTILITRFTNFTVEIYRSKKIKIMYASVAQTYNLTIRHSLPSVRFIFVSRILYIEDELRTNLEIIRSCETLKLGAT